MMRDEAGTPPAEIVRFVQRVASHDGRGRVLFVANRAFRDSLLPSRQSVRHLDPFTDAEALGFLRATPARRVLNRYCVHRKPVKAKAFKRVSTGIPDLIARRDVLVRSFLVYHDKGWDTPNPLVREIVLAGLGEMYFRLEARKSETASLWGTIQRGIDEVSVEAGLEKLYLYGAELLEHVGERGRAIDLLREGIGRIPADKSLSSLYQTAGVILSRSGRYGNAIELLQEGMARIPFGHFNRERVIEPTLQYFSPWATRVAWTP